MRATIALLFFCAASVMSAGAGEGTFELAEGWEYRWGDSPFDPHGLPVWVEDEGPWQEIDYPSNPPGRDGRRNVWYRIRLPYEKMRDPALYISSVDIIIEVYFDGKPIYSYGEFDRFGAGRFQGWPWHLISLPENFGGEYLYFRIYSDYRDIGLWGDILLGRGFDQIRRIYGRDILQIVVAILSTVISVIFLVLFLLNREDRANIHLSLIMLLLVLRILAQIHVRQFLLNIPMVWEYLGSATYFLIPTFIALFLSHLLRPQYRRITTVMWIGILVLCIITLGGALIGLYDLAHTYVGLDIISLVIMLALGTLSVKAAAGGNVEARLLTVNFIVMAVLVIYGMLVSNSLLPWADDVTYLIGFQFSLGLGCILIRRFILVRRRIQEYTAKMEAQSAELKTLTSSLEKKVAERTYQLNQVNERLQEEKISLQITSITDVLTGLYNRRYILDRYGTAIGEARRYGRNLSVVMMDIDRFKSINDSYGHPLGDMVLRQIGGVFKETLRDSDLAGRYGGEEFLLILQETDAEEAFSVAERIRTRVEALRFEPQEFTVTISGGIAELVDGDERLLERADDLLYQAKELGRNRIER